MSDENGNSHKGENKLIDNAEPLWRQVPEAYIDKKSGIPSSQAFRPTTKDQGKVSIARGSVVDADEARRRHRARGYDSIGVLSVTVGEAAEQTLTVWDDSAQAGVPEEHGYIDFRELPSKGQQQRRAAHLLNVALTRGWVHRGLFKTPCN